MASMIAVRNVDEDTYRRFKARAALDGMTVGAAMTEAMVAYLDRGRGPGERGRP